MQIKVCEDRVSNRELEFRECEKTRHQWQGWLQRTSLIIRVKLEAAGRVMPSLYPGLGSEQIEFHSVPEGEGTVFHAADSHCRGP